jgi:hypothetical protein
MYAHIVTLALGIMLGIAFTIATAVGLLMEEDKKRKQNVPPSTVEIPTDPETWSDEDRMTVDLLRRELDAQVIDIKNN